MNLPRPIEALIGELAKLPGVGRRSAERMAFDLVVAPRDRQEALLAALQHVADEVGLCATCGYFTDGGHCGICEGNRDEAMLLVVEKPLDVVAVEKAGGYRGLYHVLGGHLSPLKGITPDHLRIDSLMRRLAPGVVSELILATSPSVEGDATALYIARHLPRADIRVTRLGRGMPMGGSLEFSDAGTLRMALEGRRALDSP